MKVVITDSNNKKLLDAAKCVKNSFASEDDCKIINIHSFSDKDKAFASEFSDIYIVSPFCYMKSSLNWPYDFDYEGLYFNLHSYCSYLIELYNNNSIITTKVYDDYLGDSEELNVSDLRLKDLFAKIFLLDKRIVFLISELDAYTQIEGDLNASEIISEFFLFKNNVEDETLAFKKSANLLKTENLKLVKENTLFFKQLHSVEEKYLSLLNDLRVKEDEFQTELEALRQKVKEIDFSYQGKVVESEKLAIEISTKNSKINSLLANSDDLSSDLDSAKVSLEIALDKNRLYQSWEDHGKKAFLIRYKKLAKQKEKHNLMLKILDSGLFDVFYYKNEYSVKLERHSSYIEHFLEEGIAKNYRPSIRFDNDKYLLRYRDVADSGMHGLIHYVLFGKDEKRQV